MITIVTPTLNSRSWIIECIRSVDKQRRDGVEVEHIIVDGGSTDGTIEYCLRLKCVRLIVEQNCSISGAMNIGISNAKGTIIGWLNSDDRYIDGALLKVWQTHLRNNREWYIGNTIKRKANGDAPNAFVNITWKSFQRSPEELRTPAGFYSRELLKRIWFKEELKYVMDLGLYLDLFAIGVSPYMIKAYLTIFTVHDNQVSGVSNISKQTREMTSLLFRNGLYLSAIKKFLRSKQIIIIKRVKLIIGC